MYKILRWIVLVLSAFFAAAPTLSARDRYSVIFYNVENLFDIFEDPQIQDKEFLPQSVRHWTKRRFEDKLIMIYKALITAGDGQPPDIVGLAEVENLGVIEQLIQKTPLSKVPYGIIHKE